MRALLTVSRYEFAGAGLFFLLTVSALVLGSWANLWGDIHLVLWGALMWYLSHMIGSQVNCLADYELDRSHKGHLSAAVDVIGRKGIWLWIVIESVLAFLVTLHMSQLTGKWALPLLWVVGWLVTVAYSLEPLRLKRRGVLNPISLIAVLYILPVAYGYVALTDKFDVAVVSLFAAVGLQILSLILMNEVEDIPEDTAHHIETPCVQYGLGPVSLTAVVLLAIGSVVSLAALSVLVESWSARVVIIAIGTVGQLLILHDLVTLAIISRRTDQDGIGSERIRRLGRRNPLHFVILGLTLGVGSVLSLG